MVNRSKSVGTAAETAVTRYLNRNGFAGAERIALKGVDDEGDIGVCPGVMVEVKGGHAAEAASDAQVEAWLDETERERRARGAVVGFLVWKRKGKGAPNAGQWWAAMDGRTFVGLSVDVWAAPPWLPNVRMTLTDAVALLRQHGYGDPISFED